MEETRVLDFCLETKMKETRAKRGVKLRLPEHRTRKIRTRGKALSFGTFLFALEKKSTFKDKKV